MSFSRVSVFPLYGVTNNKDCIDYGKEINDSKSQARTEILNAGEHPLLTLRTPEVRIPQIRLMPYLLSRTGFKGRDPRRNKSKLVKRGNRW